MKHVKFTPISNSDVEKIKNHLMLHGPLAMLFQLNNDVTYYKGGDKVLSESKADDKGKKGGMHWVIIGGWGKQDGKDYRQFLECCVQKFFKGNFLKLSNCVLVG